MFSKNIEKILEVSLFVQLMNIDYVCSVGFDDAYSETSSKKLIDSLLTNFCAYSLLSCFEL